ASTRGADRSGGASSVSAWGSMPLVAPSSAPPQADSAMTSASPATRQCTSINRSADFQIMLAAMAIVEHRGDFEEMPLFAAVSASPRQPHGADHQPDKRWALWQLPEA